jgi:hypothetical protein
MSSDITAFHDGFQVRKPELAVPADTRDLDPQTKRDFTICNLFINQKLTISDIIRVLDEDYGHVVMALLESGVIQDRRQRQRRPPAGVERRRAGHT